MQLTQLEPTNASPNIAIAAIITKQTPVPKLNHCAKNKHLNSVKDYN